MLKAIDNYFDTKEEPIKSCLQALRAMIITYDKNITETWKYGMPMYCYKDKMFCYLWVHKKFRQPYIGFVEGNKIDHPILIQEKRARMKIMLLDPEKDIPIKTIRSILRELKSLYR